MCPFKSKAQARWMYANKPKMAAEWEDKTKSIKRLPEHVKKKKPKPKTKRRTTNQRNIFRRAKK